MHPSTHPGRAITRIDSEPPDSGVRARGPDSSEELLLLSGLIAGKPHAWRQLEQRYARLMLSCISRVTTRFSNVRPDDVRDIYSTLLLQLLCHDKRKLRSFEHGRGTRLGTWLGMLATHAAYDFLRSVRREPCTDELDAAEALCSEVPDPSEITLQRERMRLLGNTLARLSERDREFVRLYYAEGLPPEEIASRMGISVKTVYTRKHKLQGRLETLLADERMAA